MVGGVHFLLFPKDPFLGKMRPFFDSYIDCFTNPERKMIAPSLVQGGRKGGVRLGVLGLENRLCDLEQDSHLLLPEFSLNQRWLPPWPHFHTGQKGHRPVREEWGLRVSQAWWASECHRWLTVQPLVGQPHVSEPGFACVWKWPRLTAPLWAFYKTTRAKCLA